MNNQNMPSFEEKIYQATYAPEPDPQFDKTLWARIVDIDQQKNRTYTLPQRANQASQSFSTAVKWPFFRNLRSRMALILAIVLAGCIFVFATPTGSALAQSVITFFIQLTSDSKPAPTSVPLVWVEQTPGVPAATLTPQPGPAFHDQCGESNEAPHCTVEQIRNQVTFPVKELGTIPEPLNFIGANGGPDLIYIVYDTQDKSGGLILYQQPWENGSADNKWEIGASAVVESVEVGDVSGEYVKGAFEYKGRETLMHWDADADNQLLQWVDDGVFFQMQSFGRLLDRDELIALANSLTDQPVAENTAPSPETVTPTDELFDFHERFPLTLSEAEEMTGFKLSVPEKLPEFLFFLGAKYDPEQKVATQFYLFNQDMGYNTDGLSLSEEMIPSTGVAYLGNFVVGDKTILDKYPSGTVVGYYDEVQIGENTGQYVEGVFMGTDCCGWEWKSDPYLKTLRWQMNGKNFELQYMGMSLTKEDLLKIAASME